MCSLPLVTRVVVMTSRIVFALFYLVFALATPANSGNLWPPRNYDPGLVTEWNALLVDALPPTLGADVARYYALMHIAMYDAVTSIDGGDSIRARVPAARHASSDAAAAQAAHDVLTALLPAHKASFDAALSARLASINPERAALGVRVGHEVAKRVLKPA
jgi:hypothetical protein